MRKCSSVLRKLSHPSCGCHGLQACGSFLFLLQLHLVAIATWCFPQKGADWFSHIQIEYKQFRLELDQFEDLKFPQSSWIYVLITFRYKTLWYLDRFSSKHLKRGFPKATLDMYPSYTWEKWLDRFLFGTEMLFRDAQAFWNVLKHTRSFISVIPTMSLFSKMCFRCLSIRFI